MSRTSPIGAKSFTEGLDEICTVFEARSLRDATGVVGRAPAALTAPVGAGAEAVVIAGVFAQPEAASSRSAIVVTIVRVLIACLLDPFVVHGFATYATASPRGPGRRSRARAPSSRRACEALPLPRRASPHGLRAGRRLPAADAPSPGPRAGRPARQRCGGGRAGARPAR